MGGNLHRGFESLPLRSPIPGSAVRGALGAALEQRLETREVAPGRSPDEPSQDRLGDAEEAAGLALDVLGEAAARAVEGLDGSRDRDREAAARARELDPPAGIVLSTRNELVMSRPRKRACWS